jgi:hypothetical protein
MYHEYRRGCHQCLLLIPDIESESGGYLIETLMVFYAAESHHLCKNDRVYNAAILKAIIDLAKYLDYDQDPVNFTVFEGEIRRRIWLSLSLVDAIECFRHGVRLNIPPGSYETNLPSNLDDREFGDSSITLPPSRDLAETTRTSSLLLMFKIARYFIEIQWALYEIRSISDSQTLDLDQSITTNYNWLRRVSQNAKRILWSAQCPY